MNQQIDLKQIDTLTAELYNAICFKVGVHPPVERLNELFIPTANMIRNDGASPETMTVNSFIKSFKERIEDGTIKSFYEGELNHITEIFGTIAHRFSTYETKFDLTNPEPFSIGINFPCKRESIVHYKYFVIAMGLILPINRNHNYRTY
jgi:hypothetical protein